MLPLLYIVYNVFIVQCTYWIFDLNINLNPYILSYPSIIMTCIYDRSEIVLAVLDRKVKGIYSLNSKGMSLTS